MKDLVIISAGDFGRETAWVAERMNRIRPEWNILGFVDDRKDGMVDGYPVLGTVTWLKEQNKELYVVCAIGTGTVRERIWNGLKDSPYIHLATLIDPAAIVGKECKIGEGVIICSGTVLTVNSDIGKCCIVNLNCTIGHDAVLQEFCTVHPGANISGRVQIGRCTDIGTGSKIIQGMKVAPGSRLGAGTVVVRDIEEPGTYVGIPARKIK